MKIRTLIIASATTLAVSCALAATPPVPAAEQTLIDQITAANNNPSQADLISWVEAAVRADPADAAEIAAAAVKLDSGAAAAIVAAAITQNPSKAGAIVAACIKQVPNDQQTIQTITASGVATVIALAQNGQSPAYAINDIVTQAVNAADPQYSGLIAAAAYLASGDTYKEGIRTAANTALPNQTTVINTALDGAIIGSNPTIVSVTGTAQTIAGSAQPPATGIGGILTGGNNSNGATTGSPLG